MDFPGSAKEPTRLFIQNLGNAEDVRDAGPVPVLGRSPGEGNGSPLQYSSLENHMDREAYMHAIIIPLHTSIQQNIFILCKITMENFIFIGTSNMPRMTYTLVVTLYANVL